uniref:ATP synthase complex subunit 8 n=1 Tax=Silo nigricornis TaxID=1876062 RepID=A0A7G7CEK2_9NEOP|nr:ATP synthase F0 subunit 8 [Silo nigricornis]
MPQMMPLNWLMLFIMFNLIFMIFMIMNYYNFKFIYNNNMKIKTNQKNDSKSIHNFWPLN